MKWGSEWWGVLVEAESREDEALLEQLYDKLPKIVAYCYRGDGECKLYRGNNSELILEFTV